MRIFFRADGNNSIGLGHIYRCIAISEMLPSNSEKIFIIRNPSDSIRLLLDKCFSSLIILKEKELYNEASDIANILRPDDIIILDGYSFETSYQMRIKNSGVRIICIDDINRYKFIADVVINHAGGILSSTYEIDSYTNLCLGPKYAIVRSEFWNKPSISDRQVDNVFVSLGGSDPNNDLIKVLGKIANSNKSLKLNVVTGSAYSYIENLREFISSRNDIKHYENLDASSMKRLMMKCAIAICSPSTVSYEYLSIGGELYLYVIADNQINIYNYLINETLAFPLDKFRVSDDGLIQSVLVNQRKVFDGKSQERIQNVILNEHNFIV
ncbi:MAG: UDP-2,4-diacetamido-2,4,6-trideoxy-beta-L-altropyranose hydrolase [Bacteroidetes bacterium]|nr:UDP-2,4-diacetamido-2,4,6-trideoxy-beta-L-altropyranose hydrolase [Bacteroidota bacterium]MBS1631948.1 UDP-2,4-diacetamido-2,4,6-trideoxy-beta-L-altropyranose hydrolase [Bacteroidota bacterium]